MSATGEAPRSVQVTLIRVDSRPVRYSPLTCLLVAVGLVGCTNSASDDESTSASAEPESGGTDAGTSGSPDSSPGTDSAPSPDSETTSEPDPLEPQTSGPARTTGDDTSATEGSDASTSGGSTGDDDSAGETGEAETSSTSGGEALTPIEDYYGLYLVDLQSDEEMLYLQVYFSEQVDGESQPVIHPPSEVLSVRPDVGPPSTVPAEGDGFVGNVGVAGATRVDVVLTRPDGSEHITSIPIPVPLVITSPLAGAEFTSGDAVPFAWELNDDPFIGWTFEWTYSDGGKRVVSPRSGEALPDDAPGTGTVYPYFTTHEFYEPVSGTLHLERESYADGLAVAETLGGGWAIVTAHQDTYVILLPPE